MIRPWISSTATILVTSSLVLSGCSSPSDPGADTANSDSGAMPESTGPTLSNVTLVGNPNPTVPLAAILRATTDVPTRLTLNIDDGENNWSVTPSDELTTSHEVPVLGMRPGRTHTITATVTDSAGATAESSIQVNVGAVLPSDVNKDGDVDIRDLLQLEQILTTP